MYISESSVAATLSAYGTVLADQAVIVGKAAACLALRDEETYVAPLQIMVTRELQSELERVSGWRYDPALGLVSPDRKIAVVAHDYENIAGRAWETPDGLHVASLPDVYADYDVFVWTYMPTIPIRTFLHNPKRMLDNRVIQRRIVKMWSFLPEECWGDSTLAKLVELAAHGSYIVHTLYGDPEVGRANRMVGALERAEYNTVAFYHNGFDLDSDMIALQQHFTNIGASPYERVLGMAADAYSDAVYGNGRMSHSPTSYDELRAATLIREHALLKGCDQETAERLHRIVLSTAFDEETRSQRGRKDDDPVARAVAGIDLQVLSEPDSICVTFAVAAEDSMSARFSADRTIGRVLVERVARPETLEQFLHYCDKYADDTPRDMPVGASKLPTVRQWFAQRLAGNADFHDPKKGHVYPDGWTLEDKVQRKLNADRLRTLSAYILNGGSFVEAYAKAEEMAAVG